MVDLKSKILSNIEKNRDEIIANRRYFHQNPELSEKEYNTQKKIMELLKSYGIESKKIANTGVIAEIKGVKNGKTIAIRADIDALNLVDEIDKPYKSQNNGVCHGCGHDAHAAGLLGIAKAFQENKNELQGTLKLFFEPAEESIGGADRMIKEGCLKGVENVIGTHVWQPVKVGKASVRKEMMAAIGEFFIEITGVGGHGSQPHLCVNAANIASQIVLALNTITSCRLDPREMVVLSVGKMVSGSAMNIIPETAEIRGTTRAFSVENLKKVEEQVNRMVKGICDSNDAKCKVSFTYIFPATINDERLVPVAEEAIKEVLGDVGLEPMLPNLGGESFSYFTQEVPSIFIFTGVGNDTNAIYGHHNPKFDIDENGLINGAKILSNIALKLLFQ
ncbi:MAG: amidohydrolase [Rickettsiales bacterium]|jgi:amidohydrolase|nr:amidohydrolase [Rickettsiales bacterium]